MNLRRKRFSLAMLLMFLVASPIFATFDLQITEIWPGNFPGNNLSPDWFEITNVGDMTWTAAVDGDLWFSDDSFSPVDADLMSGVASIAPGETVVFVDGGPAGGAQFTTLWSPVVSPLPPIGSFEGPDLSQEGGAIGIWVSAGPPPLRAPDFFGFYPDARKNGGQSYDTLLTAFSTVGNANGAVATLETNNADPPQPAIGSPGLVPEPATLLTLGTGLTVLVLIRRRRR